MIDTRYRMAIRLWVVHRRRLVVLRLVVKFRDLHRVLHLRGRQHLDVLARLRRLLALGLAVHIFLKGLHGLLPRLLVVAAGLGILQLHVAELVLRIMRHRVAWVAADHLLVCRDGLRSLRLLFERLPHTELRQRREAVEGRMLHDVGEHFLRALVSRRDGHAEHLRLFAAEIHFRDVELRLDHRVKIRPARILRRVFGIRLERRRVVTLALEDVADVILRLRCRRSQRVGFHDPPEDLQCRVQLALGFQRFATVQFLFGGGIPHDHRGCICPLLFAEWLPSEKVERARRRHCADDHGHGEDWDNCWLSHKGRNGGGSVRQRQAVPSQISTPRKPGSVKHLMPHHAAPVIPSSATSRCERRPRKSISTRSSSRTGAGSIFACRSVAAIITFFPVCSFEMNSNTLVP